MLDLLVVLDRLREYISTVGVSMLFKVVLTILMVVDQAMQHLGDVCLSSSRPSKIC